MSVYRGPFTGDVELLSHIKRELPKTSGAMGHSSRSYRPTGRVSTLRPAQGKFSCRASVTRRIGLFTRLKLKWGEEERAEWTLQVNLIDVPPLKTNTCKSTQKEVHSCANAHSHDECVQSCGVASGVLRYVLVFLFFRYLGSENKENADCYI